MDLKENSFTSSSTMESELEQNTRELTHGYKESYQRYGWGKFRPKRLQFLNNPKWFLVVILAYTLCQGIAVLGLLNLVLPSLERRFGFSSKELGIISASNDVSALLLVVFIGFFGDYGNKVKWMGYGAALTGVGVLLFALPHAIIEKYEPVGTRVSSLCHLSNTTNTTQNLQYCNRTSGGQWYYIAIFVVAQLIIGVGNSPYYSLLSPYLDEIVDPKSISTYLGILNFFIFTAPGIGYLIGGKILSIYVDIVQPDGYNLSPRSLAWIGAWWIGFLIFGLAILLCAVVILGFPGEMPGSKERRLKHIRQGHLKGAEGGQQPSVKKLLPELKNLLMNWTFLFSTLSVAVAILYSAPLFVFFSKLLREKFGLDPVRTAYAMSVLSIIGVLLGNTCGSLTVRLFSLRKTCKKAALMCAVVYLLTAASPLVFLIPGCNNTNLAGVTIPYYRVTTYPASPFTSQCNRNCQCSLKRFAPVCGPNSITYINPCYAGCTSILPNKTFTNCTCIPRSANSSVSGIAMPGYCDRQCKNTILFLGLCLVVLIIRFTAAVPGKLVTLRCVADNKRAFASSIQYLTLKIFGLLPSPIIFGHLVDISCRLWQDTCGKKGRCFDYDIATLSRTICIYGICVVSLATVLYFLAWYFYKSEEESYTHSAQENYGVDEPIQEVSTKL